MKCDLWGLSKRNKMSLMLNVNKIKLKTDWKAITMNQKITKKNWEKRCRVLPLWLTVWGKMTISKNPSVSIFPLRYSPPFKHILKSNPTHSYKIPSVVVLYPAIHTTKVLIGAVIFWSKFRSHSNGNRLLFSYPVLILSTQLHGFRPK